MRAESSGRERNGGMIGRDNNSIYWPLSEGAKLEGTNEKSPFVFCRERNEVRTYGPFRSYAYYCQYGGTSNFSLSVGENCETTDVLRAENP